MGQACFRGGVFRGGPENGSSTEQTEHVELQDPRDMMSLSPGPPDGVAGTEKRKKEKRTVMIAGPSMETRISPRKLSFGDQASPGSASDTGPSRPARHSVSAPQFTSPDLDIKGSGDMTKGERRARSRAQTISHPKKDEEISEGELRVLVRTLTRRASSSGSGERGMTSQDRSRRKSTAIEDEQVLRLIQEKQHEGKDVPKGLKLEGEKTNLQFEEVAEIDPKLAARISARRKTMEHLDIFSPDMRQERISELFDASEKYIASTGTAIETTPAAVPIAARPMQPRRKTLKPPVMPE